MLLFPPIAKANDDYTPGPMPSQMFRNAMQREDNESVLSEQTDKDVVSVILM